MKIPNYDDPGLTKTINTYGMSIVCKQSSRDKNIKILKYICESSRDKNINIIKYIYIYIYIYI